MNTAIDRLQPLSSDELSKVHAATLDILGDTGMCFESEEARHIFKTNGFKIDGKNVLFTEAQIRTALDSVSNKWTLMARDPEKTVEMNIDSYSIGMGGGSPFMINADSTYHPATRKDYINSLKVAQSLDTIETWRVLVIPNDLPAENANMYMMFNQIMHFNKVYALTDETSIDLLRITYDLTEKTFQY